MATQGEGELFGSLAARVKALVVDCEYVLDCPHAKYSPDNWKSDKPKRCRVDGCIGVNFKEAVVRDILLAGIRMEETRRMVLATKHIHRMPVDLIIDLVQSQESAREDAMFKPPGQPLAQAQVSLVISASRMKNLLRMRSPLLRTRRRRRNKQKWTPRRRPANAVTVI